jgi:hypothetical protein
MTEMTIELLQKPFIQALFFILITIISVFIIGPKDADNTWIIAGYIFIGFMLINSILICTVSNSWNYFFHSLGFSALYLMSVGIIIPASIKLLKIEGSAESAMIFIFIIYHPVLLLFMLFLKWAYFKLL